MEAKIVFFVCNGPQKLSKSFEKIDVLKIGELVSFWAVKTHFGKK